ncbi:MAG: TIGR03960 family B12-binding radical SAM protein [Eubacteriales bacterium]|jgi:radical SAM family uncharacterized protein
MINKDVEKILLQVQKPARYVGGELNSVVKDPAKVDVRVAFCFPDTYEIGMSHLGMKILYSLTNERENYWCERVFAPWIDMEQIMREKNIELYGLESGESIRHFDFIWFTLQYELSYSNILNMLDLAHIPLYSRDRHDLEQIVLVGGPCAYNCEPIADFVDVVILGEGEEINLRVLEIYEEIKRRGGSREEFFHAIVGLEGVYIPSFYEVTYHEDGRVQAITPKYPDVPVKVRKTIIKELDKVYYPDKFVVPSIDTVHNRVMLEVFRGCIRGCRFCQAGMIYRPVREKTPQTLNDCACKLQASTGYDEISLSSLSTSDYTRLEELVESLLEWTEPKRVNLALPSLRVDNFSSELVQKIQKVRKSSLTFAPEAGTQRLRDAINKNVREDELMHTAHTAFEGGCTAIKLYFMIGLPTETMEDVAGIGDLGHKVLDVYYGCENRNRRRGVSITLSASNFVPKPFTPFQWEPQDTEEQLKAKQKLLLSSIHSKRVKIDLHDTRISILEGVFARGDRRLCRVMEAAFRKGCRFDGWSDQFRYDKWMEAFEECGVDPAFYASRRRDFEEVLPWSHIDVGVSEEYLKRECRRAYDSQTSPNCREACGGCGANQLIGRACQ